MGRLTTTVYNSIFKRTSTFAIVVIAGAFVFERSVDIWTDFLWRRINQGKLFEDVDLKYSKLQQAAEDDE